jgi:hypothetical protein
VGRNKSRFLRNETKIYLSTFFFHSATAPSGPRPHCEGFTIILGRILGRVINPTQRPLPDTTQHSQDTDIHASGGIRTRNLSKRGAADPRLRLRGYCDRHKNLLCNEIW